MLRWAANVLHFVEMSELMLFKQAVNMKLGELEGTLVHAFLLHIENVSRVRHIQKLMFNLLYWEGSQLLKADYQCFVIIWKGLRFEFLHDIEIDLARANNNLLVVLALTERV